MNDEYTPGTEPESESPIVHDTVFDDDGTYRIVHPEQADTDDRSYTDANFQPQADAAEVPPRYYAPPRKKEKPSGGKKGGFWRVACLCLACAVLGGAAGGAVTSRMTRTSEPASAAQVQTSDDASGGDASGALTTEPVSTSGAMTASEIYAEACQQVVGISTEVTVQNIFGQTSSSAVTGTGFITTTDGYILTNYHVISYAAQYGYAVTVMTYDGTTYTAKIVGYDANNDIAVLKIDADGLTPVTFGDSSGISVGDTVYAVGNPLGELEFTMTTGHVSALDRTITTDESSVPINMFQIDAAVNEGNSGGPVYNAAGQVIGVVTAKYSSEGVEGLGFAIPVNDAVSIANELMENGFVVNKVQLGITNARPIPASVAQYYNMVEGVYILSLKDGSCAQNAGLQVGDIITAVDGKQVTSVEAVRAALRGYAPGDTIDITFFRAGETQTVTVTLDEADEDTVASQQQTQTEPQTPQQSAPWGR